MVSKRSAFSMTCILMGVSSSQLGLAQSTDSLSTLKRDACRSMLSSLKAGETAFGKLKLSPIDLPDLESRLRKQLKGSQKDAVMDAMRTIDPATQASIKAYMAAYKKAQTGLFSDKGDAFNKVLASRLNFQLNRRLQPLQASLHIPKTDLEVSSSLAIETIVENGIVTFKACNTRWAQEGALEITACTERSLIPNGKEMKAVPDSPNLEFVSRKFHGIELSEIPAIRTAGKDSLPAECEDLLNSRPQTIAVPVIAAPVPAPDTIRIDTTQKNVPIEIPVTDSIPNSNTAPVDSIPGQTQQAE